MSYRGGKSTIKVWESTVCQVVGGGRVYGGSSVRHRVLIEAGVAVCQRGSTGDGRHNDLGSS